MGRPAPLSPNTTEHPRTTSGRSTPCERGKIPMASRYSVARILKECVRHKVKYPRARRYSANLSTSASHTSPRLLLPLGLAIGDGVRRKLCSREHFIFLLIVNSQVSEMSPNTRISRFGKRFFSYEMVFITCTPSSNLIPNWGRKRIT